MRTLLILVAASLLGCAHRTGPDLQSTYSRSLPRDASVPLPDGSPDYQCSLAAEGSDWSVSVNWNPSELTRFVTWQQGGNGFSLGIPLRNRPEPYTSQSGIIVTRYGPYQPACMHRHKGTVWHVVMSHEQADFPSEEDLRKMLESFLPGSPHAEPVLSPEGILVMFRGPLYSHTESLAVEIWILTVAGEKPRVELLSPYVTGKVSIGMKQSIKGVS